VTFNVVCHRKSLYRHSEVHLVGRAVIERLMRLLAPPNYTIRARILIPTSADPTAVR